MQIFVGVVLSADRQEFSNNLITTNVGLKPRIFFFITLTLADKTQI